MTSTAATEAAASRPAPDPPTPPQRLEHFPVSVFAVVMGLAGAAVAWQRVADQFPVSAQVGAGLAWFSLGLYGLVALAYGLKTVRYPAVVTAEWRHPVRLAFVPTASVALLLLAVAFLDVAPDLSAALWWAGAVVQAVLTVEIVRFWIADDRFQPGHVHPAWFIPVVGTLAAPLAGVEHAPPDVSWFFFAVGIIYWLALFAVVLNRLVVGGALPPRLAPTVAVLVAPPAVAFLAWRRLGEDPAGPVGRILLGVTIFQLLLLAVQAPALHRVPFALSAWAYSFPLAAATVALFAAGDAGMGGAYSAVGVALLAILTVVILGLVARTAVAVRRHEICRPE